MAQVLGSRTIGLQKLGERLVSPWATWARGVPGLRLLPEGEPQALVPDSSPPMLFFRPDDCILHFLNCPSLWPNPRPWSGLDIRLIFKNLLRLDAWGLTQSQNGHYPEEMIIVMN